MSISSAGTEISPRQKNAKLKGENTVEVENNQGQSVKTDKVEPGTALPVQVESPNKLDTNGTLAVAGVRPIGNSDLQVAETLSIAGVRPVSTSELQVVGTYNSMGIRPIGANTINVVSSINLSGIRPIASSALVVSESYSIFGNRPVASNEIEDSGSLMGFLD